MPIIFDDELDRTNISQAGFKEGVAYNPSTTDPEDLDTRDPTIAQSATAYFRKYNPLSTGYEYITRDKEITDPTFNPFKEGNNIEFPAEAKRYIYADNDDEIEAINKQIRKEKEWDNTIQNSGFMGTVAGLATFAIDPTIFIPATAGMKTLKALRAYSGFARAGAGAAVGGVGGTAAIGIQEAMMHAARPGSVDKMESYRAMMFGGIAGAVFGGGLAFMSRAATRAAVHDLRDIDAGIMNKITATDEGIAINTKDLFTQGSVGAAKVSRENILEQEGLAWMNVRAMERIAANLDPDDELRTLLTKRARQQEQVFKMLSSPIEAMRSPVIRGITSSFGTVRRFTNELFDHPFILGRDVEGIARNPIERELKLANADIVNYASAVRQEYLKYAGVSGTGEVAQITAAIKKATAKGRVLGIQEFSEEVGKAVISGKKHPIEGVNKLANLTRAVNKKYGKMLADAGVISKEVIDNNPNYLTRMYNKALIIENSSEFIELMYQIVRRGYRNPVYTKLKAAGKETKNVKKWINEPIKDEVQAEKIAEKMFDNIIGEGDNAMVLSHFANNIATKSSKFMKARSILTDDPMLSDQLNKFLKFDVQQIVTNYVHKAAAIVNFQKMLARNGWETPGDIIRDLRAEKDRIAAEGYIHPITGKRKMMSAAKLKRKFESEKELVEDMTSIIMGTIQRNKTSIGSRSLQWLRKYNLVNKLGFVSIASIPDIAMPIFKHGLGRASSTAFESLVKSRKAVKAANAEYKRFGVALELEDNGILRALAEGDPLFGMEDSRLARFGDATVQLFGKVSGLSYWNVAHKRLWARTSAARSIEDMLKWANTGKVSVKEKARLAALGLDQSDATYIKQMFDRGIIEDVKGVYVPNFDQWPDFAKAQRFAKSVVSDVDSTIVTPGLGDIPIPIQKSEVLKTIFQFKSFSAAATNKILLSGLQRRDMTALIGFQTLVLMGAMGYVIRQLIQGKEPESDIDKLIAEGVSRSGVLGLMGDYVMALNPHAKSSRYSALNANSILLGPSASLAGDAYQAFIKNPYDALIGDETAPRGLSDKELEKMRRLLPYQNIWYLNYLWRQVLDEDKED